MQWNAVFLRQQTITATPATTAKKDDAPVDLM